MGLGWGNLAGAIGEIIGKVTTYIPGRIEKLKNEKASLNEERAALIKGKYDYKKGTRLVWIDNRINAINRLLSDKATD